MTHVQELPDFSKIEHDDMTEEEWRAFVAAETYRATFGDERYPDIDQLPEQYHRGGAFVALLERCISEGKPVDELVEVQPLDPGVIY